MAKLVFTKPSKAPTKLTISSDRKWFPFGPGVRHLTAKAAKAARDGDVGRYVDTVAILETVKAAARSVKALG